MPPISTLLPSSQASSTQATAKEDFADKRILEARKIQEKLKLKTLKFIDLFAGIGGIRIAFDRNNCNCVFTSEWDIDCQKTYKANFGGDVNGDITKIDEKNIPDHDILTGGFPCQAFSIIGDGKGFSDTRGTLFFEIVRILEEKQPYAFLLENVKQLVSHNGGETFNVIISALKELGYFVHYKVLNALHFGVPQKRERIIIVGFKNNHPFHFPTKGKRALTLKDVLESDEKVDPKHFVSERAQKRFLSRVKHVPECPTIWHENKSGNIGVHPYSCALRAGASYNYLTVNGKRRLTPRENLRLQGFPDHFKIVVPGTAIRKQAGNSVPVPMIEAVASCMMDALGKDPLPPISNMKLL